MDFCKNFAEFSPWKIYSEFIVLPIYVLRIALGQFFHFFHLLILSRPHDRFVLVVLWLYQFSSGHRAAVIVISSLVAAGAAASHMIIIYP